MQVRLLAVSAAVLAAARFSPSYLSSKALGFVHLLAFGTYVGTNIWTTFIAGLTMFKNLPRQVCQRSDAHDIAVEAAHFCKCLQADLAAESLLPLISGQQ